METVEVVIRIPRFAYNMTRANHKVIYADEEIIGQAIINGTVLPKNHGRLINADELKKYIDDCDCCVGCENESYGCSDKCKCPDYLDEDMERIINNQPTIIEADKEEENGTDR